MRHVQVRSDEQRGPPNNSAERTRRGVTLDLEKCQQNQMARSKETGFVDAVDGENKKCAECCSASFLLPVPLTICATRFNSNVGFMPTSHSASVNFSVDPIVKSNTKTAGCTNCRGHLPPISQMKFWMMRSGSANSQFSFSSPKFEYICGRPSIWRT